MSVLMHTYRNDILPELRTKRGYGNVQEVPKITKIAVSSGIGSDKDREVFDEALRTLGDIVGQRPIITKAKTSIAGFKLREGQNVGVSVTLRGQRMYDFLYRLINVALPRVRDFRGVSSTASAIGSPCAASTSARSPANRRRTIRRAALTNVSARYISLT